MSQINVFSRRVFIKDLVIAAIIVALPFLFYLYLLVPEVKVWETKFFTLESKYFEDLNVFAWTLMTKLLTLIILSIWFITCKHWWRYAILIPLVIECYKITIILNNDLFYLDNDDFINSLPITLPLFIILIYLSKKLNYYSLSKSLDNQLDEEIDMIMKDLSKMKSKDFKNKRNRFEALKKERLNLDKMEYLKQLIALKNNLLID